MTYSSTTLLLQQHCSRLCRPITIAVTATVYRAAYRTTRNKLIFVWHLALSIFVSFENPYERRITLFTVKDWEVRLEILVLFYRYLIIVASSYPYCYFQMDEPLPFEEVGNKPRGRNKRRSSILKPSNREALQVRCPPSGFWRKLFTVQS